MNMVEQFLNAPWHTQIMIGIVVTMGLGVIIMMLCEGVSDWLYDERMKQQRLNYQPPMPRKRVDNRKLGRPRQRATAAQRRAAAQ